jgi:hypothetical protein
MKKIHSPVLQKMRRLYPLRSSILMNRAKLNSDKIATMITPREESKSDKAEEKEPEQAKII